MDAKALVLSLLPKGVIGAEIGVFRGEFSRRIVDVAMPAKLFLVDPWQNSSDPEHAASFYAAGSDNNMEEIFQSVCAQFAEDSRIEIVRSSSSAFFAAISLNFLDFVYIDGDHSYDAVKADLAMAYVALKPRGLLCIDDYMLDAWWGGGVVRAVNEFVGTNRVLLLLKQGHQVVVRKL